MSSEKHDPHLFLPVKETTKTDLYDTDLPEFDTSNNEKVYNYIPDKQYFVFNFLSSTTLGIRSNPTCFEAQ